MTKTPPQQRSRSYTEHSPLLSSPAPSRWHRHHLHQHRTSLRQDVWTVLRFRSSVQHRSGLQFASYVLELSILTLILLNVVVAISDSAVMVQSPSEGSSVVSSLTSDWSQTFLLVSTIIFSIEYALRLWSCVEDDRFSSGPIMGRIKWMTRPLSLIDLMSLIPFYLELSIELDDNSPYHGGLTLRSLRLLRIISFLRLERMYNAMKNLRVIFARKKEEFMVVLYLTAVVVLTASLMIFFLEHKAQPKVFSSFAVCAWWSVETITSLGYGDVVPVTGLGRLLGAMLALWGIVLFTIPGAVLGSGFIEVMLEKQREEEAEIYSMAMGRPTSISSSNACPNMLLARLRTSTAVNRTFQTRGLKNMLGGLTSKTEKAAAQAEEAAQTAEPGDIVLDGFAKRQFDDKTYSGSQVDFDKTEFVNKVNEIYEANGKQLVDGYAPFCKHLFIKNFTGARLNTVAITQANEHMMLSDYEARTEYELPVLNRWFPSHSVTPTVAEYLDIILYSREQIIKENEAVAVPANPLHENAAWGIVSIKSQDVDYELPMKPITMMRNAVGKEQGGSGVPIDREEYMKAVEYWRNHAVIKKM
ncbi:hypothetical protein BBO99_00006869 [Phytophthora kernoviae]|uniref:Ion transport domain-containing protein n=2 Tax=Phytophthora kernoviae TaxID=325452 RepID=A0A421F239_9STRA|nr:hypothetical protein G195_007719 [Phytophthora kernoviae 00238/432]KAG2520987.1 hypothetical protein JM16_006499 [Phytophthora kernoviae]KAG2522046.1 hypothetical protein JM18_006306 [Phytophthora kernoviae]RLN15196.1 hypothetical protein BBI17_006905 [Phytophthora kernoviae]RLN77294.1 hypothetical protein BBO99_00006869 [Phytophthora kernoviae]